MPKPTPISSKPSATAFAVAACSLALTGGREMQLLPAGVFRARDGRPHDAPHWMIDAALAEKLIAAAALRTTPYVTDYDHQTLRAKENGKPAPAAGWFSRLEWREGVGLFAVDVEWNAPAAALIAANEYKFVSPVIGYDKATGAVTSLYMAAICNDPAIDGMDPVLLSAAALNFSLSPPTPLNEDIAMDELLEQLRWMLNLPVGAPPEDITAHLQKLIDQLKALDPAATAAASFDLPAFIKTQREQIVSLSTATPNPAKFVPIEALQAVQTQLAALSAESNAGQVDAAITAALAAGKLVPAMETWARDLGKKDYAALTAYLDTAPAIVALGSTQTGGTPPVPGAGTLTPNQVALCTAMGVSQEAFLKTLQAEQQG